ncbi:hypothetical protein KAI68_04180 [bacterium]|nr:hypothetical protein [bacterium]
MNIVYWVIIVLCSVFFLGIDIYYTNLYGIGFFSSNDFLGFMIAVILIYTGIFHRKYIGKKTAKVRRLAGLMILLMLIIAAYWGKSSPPGYNPFLFLGLAVFFVYLVITTD